MKNLIILFSLLFSILATFAQNDFTDEVYPSNGDKPYLNCKILEITHDNIVTFLYQDQAYQIQAISIKKDGQYVDLSSFVSEDKNTLIELDLNETTLEKNATNTTAIDRRYSYSAIGLGFGNAYGILGIQFQFRDGKTFGLGGHLGAGIIPRIGEMSKISFGFTIGAKVFVYKSIFLDITYGAVGVSNYGTLLGPSLLTGADLFFGKTLGLNIAGGLSYYRGDVALTLDLGLLIKLPGRK